MWKSRLARVQAISAAVIVFVTAFYTYYAREQAAKMEEATAAARTSANAAKKSAEVAEKALVASERPWLSVRLEIGSGLKFGPQEGLGILSEPQASIAIRHRITNVGRSPALGVEVRGFIYLLSPKLNQAKEQSIWCAPREPRRPGDQFAGQTLFPNHEFVFAQTYTFPQADFAKALAGVRESEKNVPADFRLSTFLLMGCVHYYSAAIPTVSERVRLEK